MVQDYELLLLMTPEANEERLKAELEKIRKNVTDQGGVIATEESLGRRRLAYRIGRFAEGQYHRMDVQLDKVQAKALENTLNLTEDVVRYLLINKVQIPSCTVEERLIKEAKGKVKTKAPVKAG